MKLSGRGNKMSRFIGEALNHVLVAQEKENPVKPAYWHACNRSNEIPLFFAICRKTQNHLALALVVFVTQIQRISPTLNSYFFDIFLWMSSLRKAQQPASCKGIRTFV